MFGIDWKYTDTSKAVTDAADKATFKNLAHAAAALRLAEQGLIKNEPGPSAPGTPPHTHTQGVVKRGKNAGKVRKGRLPRSFAFDVNKAAKDAFIGPKASIVGPSAHEAEFGESDRGPDPPERSFAKPALEIIAPRFGDSFAGSITGG